MGYSSLIYLISDFPVFLGCIKSAASSEGFYARGIFKNLVPLQSRK